LPQILAEIFARKNDSPFQFVKLCANADKSRQNSPNCNWRVSIMVRARHRSWHKKSIECSLGVAAKEQTIYGM